MQSARYLGPNRIEVLEVSVPTLNQGEALVEVEACGICASDLSIFKGVHPRARPPLTPGHEFCGRVVDIKGIGESSIRVSDRVTAYPLISCGRCFACRHGNPHVCRELKLYGFDGDGGMAEYVKLPVRNLIKISESLTSDVGAMIEPLAVGIHSFSRIPIQPEDTVLILGAGTIGLVTALVARERGVRKLLITDVAPCRIELARELGFEALDARDPGLVAAILGVTNGEGADVLFECTGSPDVALQMTDLVRVRGTVVNAGVFKKPALVNLQAVNFKELQMAGSRVYAFEDFRSAAELAPSLPLSKLTTDHLPLTQAAVAFDMLVSGAHGKILLEPQGA
ncbi:MAG: alcohol dehydrogenase catalytic domain-containing protein [Terriglobia bacterium]|jgi:2-desacetyl-2-hydroxyethyl bacteriochlorophyllide A dehydrogenase